MDKLGFVLWVGVLAYIGYVGVKAFNEPPEPVDNGPVKGYGLPEIVRATWDDDANIGAMMEWMQAAYPVAPESQTNACAALRN